MKTLDLRLTIDADGVDADAIVGELQIDAETGQLDQAALNLLRAHLARYNDERDWRIVNVSVRVAGELDE